MLPRTTARRFHGWTVWPVVALLAARVDAQTDDGGAAAADSDESSTTTTEETAKEVEERRVDEAALNEDPEAQRRARRLAEQTAVEEAGIGAEQPAPAAGEPAGRFDLELYASARLHVINLYEFDTESEDVKLGDGNSRVGARGEWQLGSDRFLFARTEIGLDLVNPTTTRGGSSADDDLDVRLAYAGYTTDDLTFVVGRNWSAYYQVAGITDRFAIFGGSASGAYNAGTSGDATGTGRATDVAQIRYYIDPGSRLFRAFKPFNLNLQYQAGQPIPGVADAKYDYSWGASAFLETTNELYVGIAYNTARVPVGQAINDAGIDGDATAWAVATRAYGSRWYAAILFSRLVNMERTDEGQYFDGRGVEFYAQWELREKWWLTVGYNWLEPDGGEIQAGDYEVRYGIIGGRYSFRSFERMMYLEYRADDGRLANGRFRDDELTFGIRWDFGN